MNYYIIIKWNIICNWNLYRERRAASRWWAQYKVTSWWHHTTTPRLSAISLSLPVRSAQSLSRTWKRWAYSTQCPCRRVTLVWLIPKTEIIDLWEIAWKRCRFLTINNLMPGLECDPTKNVPITIFKQHWKPTPKMKMSTRPSRICSQNSSSQLRSWNCRLRSRLRLGNSKYATKRCSTHLQRMRGRIAALGRETWRGKCSQLTKLKRFSRAT